MNKLSKRRYSIGALALSSALISNVSADEVSRASYNVTADVDVNGELTEGADNSFVVHNSTIEFTIPDASTIKSGDTITFKAVGFNFVGEQAVKLQDGTIIGRLTKTVLPDARTNQRAGKVSDADASDANNYSEIAEYKITFNDTFQDPSKVWSDVSFSFTNRGSQSHGFADHEREFLLRFEDSQGATIDSFRVVAKADTTVDTPGAVTDTYNKFRTSTGVHNLNTNSLSLGYLGYAGDTKSYELRDLPAGTTIKYDYSDNVQNYLNIDLTKMTTSPDDANGPQPVVVGQTYTADGTGLLTLAGSPVNGNGYYTSNSEPMTFKVVELTKDSVKIELLSGMTRQGMASTAFFNTAGAVEFNELSNRTIDTTTGFAKDDVWGVNGLTVSVNSPTGASATYVQNLLVNDQGSWAGASGQFTPKYKSYLNGVLEDGTVIATKMDATDFLDVGTDFTLNGLPSIEYQGKRYVPKLGTTAVNGQTIEGEQTLNLVYVLDKAIVNLTVNHINKDTGETFETERRADQVEGTTYTTSAKTYPDYNLVETPANANGTFGKTDVVVNYYYTMKKGSLVEKFVDANGVEIATQKNTLTNANIKTPYNVTPPQEITNGANKYRLVSSDKPLSGQIVEGTTTITHRYELVKGSLVEKFVDAKGKEIAAPKNTLSNVNINTDYTVTPPQEITHGTNKYRLVSSDKPLTGTVVEGTTTITHTYSLLTGSVVQKFVDTTGKEIKAPVNAVVDKPVNSDYSLTHPLEIRVDGVVYRYVSMDKPEKGKVVEGTTTITYTYSPVVGGLRLHWVDDKGVALFPSEDNLVNEPIGTSFDVTNRGLDYIKTDDGRTFKKTSVSGITYGKLLPGLHEITFYYKEVKGTVVTKLQTRDGRDLVSPIRESDLLVGVPYDTLDNAPTTLTVGSQRYTRVEVPVDAKGTTIEGTITVIYVYEPAKIDIPVNPADPAPETPVKEVVDWTNTVTGSVKVNFVDRNGNKIFESVLAEKDRVLSETNITRTTIDGVSTEVAGPTKTYTVEYDATRVKRQKIVKDGVTYVFYALKDGDVEKGLVKEGITEVTYIYEPAVEEIPNEAPKHEVPEAEIKESIEDKVGTVRVHFVDKDGNPIKDSETLHLEEVVKRIKKTEITINGVTTPVVEEVSTDAKYDARPHKVMEIEYNGKTYVFYAVKEGDKEFGLISEGVTDVTYIYEIKEEPVVPEPPVEEPVEPQPPVEPPVTPPVTPPAPPVTPPATPPAPPVEPPVTPPVTPPAKPMIKKITVYVDEYGKELIPHTDGWNPPAEIDGYTPDAPIDNEETGVRKYIYRKNKTSIPNEAPKHEVPELKITRFVDENGNDISEIEEGFTNSKVISGYEFEKTSEDGSVRTHVYKKVVAPEVPVTPVTPEVPVVPAEPVVPVAPVKPAEPSVKTTQPLPKTGDSGSLLGIVGASLGGLSLSGLGTINRRRKQVRNK